MISFSHPTPMKFDECGSSLGRGFPDFSDWCYARFSGTVHEMTVQQMHDYNVRSLGEIGTAVYEALPAPKKRPDGVIAWHQKICACGIKYGKCKKCRKESKERQAAAAAAKVKK